jgi:murein DD-endopeptidase MepM/ murein hydrolase activator NlpD
MRFLKIVPAFFLIGFFAGSLESASGLGHFEQSRVLVQRTVDASIVKATTDVMSLFSAAEQPIELRPQALTLPEDIAMAVRAEFNEPPQALQRIVPTKSMLFLPEEPEWWDERRRGGLPRMSDFGPKRPVSLPDRDILSPAPPVQPVSLPPPPEEVKRAATRKADGKSRNTDDVVVRQEFIMPFDRGRVTSMFNQGRRHPAIDLAGRLGTPVHATTHKQRVTFTGWMRGYGYTVKTRDPSGRTHLYAHLQRTVAKVGAVLNQGQTLGLLGSTGRSTGPHVHYEVHTSAGRHINPATLLFSGRRVGRGFAWNSARSVTRVASNAQPLPR